MQIYFRRKKHILIENQVEPNKPPKKQASRRGLVRRLPVPVAVMGDKGASEPVFACLLCLLACFACFFAVAWLLAVLAFELEWCVLRDLDKGRAAP